MEQYPQLPVPQKEQFVLQDKDYSMLTEPLNKQTPVRYHFTKL